MMNERLAARWTVPVVVVLTVAALILIFTAGGSSRLRDRHSQPVPAVTLSEVAVVPEGKLFHAPGCRFIHGRPRMEPTALARAEGYTPCPRCLGPLRNEQASAHLLTRD